MSALPARMRIFWRPEAGVFVALWLLLLVGGRSRLFRDPGTFWHTRVGRIALSSGLVHGDPFSFTEADTAAGRAWIPHQWLGEIFMALVHAWNGWDGLLFVTVGVLACLYTWLAHRLMRAGLHWSLAVSFTGLALAAGSNHFHVRPHLATLVFFGMTCAFLIDFEAGRKRLGELFWLVPAYALWANLHGGLVGGVVTMILAGLGWSAARGLGGPSPFRSFRDQVIFGGLVTACVLTAFVSPYGWRLPGAWLAIMNTPHLAEIIQEHARLNASTPEGLTVIALAVLYVAMMASVRPWRPQVTWIIPPLWLFFACLSVRHAPLFGIAGVLTMAEIFPQTRWAQSIVERGGDLYVPPEKAPPDPRGLGLFALPAVVVLFSLLLQSNTIPTTLGTTPWAEFDPQLWPTELVPQLKAEDGPRIFNELNLGGFVIYHAPHLRVFIDDRCELYGAEFLREYDRAARTEPRKLENWRKEYGFGLALTLRGSPFDSYLRESPGRWTVLAEAEAATLFRYTGPSSAGE